MITFACGICQKKLLTFDGESRPICCGQPAAHAPDHTSLTKRDVVDTGLMARRLEVVADVVSLQRDRDSPTTIK